MVRRSEYYDNFHRSGHLTHVCGVPIRWEYNTANNFMEISCEKCDAVLTKVAAEFIEQTEDGGLKWAIKADLPKIAKEHRFACPGFPHFKRTKKKKKRRLVRMIR